MALFILNPIENASVHSEITLQQVTKKFGNLTAVNDCSLTIEKGSFFSLLGPSGCGKTTLLRILAGFEQPDTGKVWIRGEEVTVLSPQKRPTAMVFQNYALFPTMTVGENVAYGLKVKKLGKAEIQKRVSHTLEKVSLQGLEKKPVTQLSGGQQQRVALARALAVQPQVLLFDEPLSNLDVALREQTRRELKLLQKEVGTTSIYVTHDQQEALALSDTIAVMNAGEIQQVGTPEELYFHPKTSFVASFLGGGNLIKSGKLIAQLTKEPRPENHILSIKPEHWQQQPQTENFVFHVQSKQFLGTHIEYAVLWENIPLRISLSPQIDLGDTFSALPTHIAWIPEKV